MPNKEEISKILSTHFKVQALEIIDDSHKHAGHNELAKRGGTHMSVTIVSDDFTDKSRVERHKMIYKALDSAFAAGLHALAIKALTIKEAS